MKQCTYCGRECDDNAVNCSGCGLAEFKSDDSAQPKATDDADNLVTLMTCQKLTEADLVVSKLGGLGVEAFLPDAQLMQTIGFNVNTYGYVRVQVRQSDLKAAKDILAS